MKNDFEKGQLVWFCKECHRIAKIDAKGNAYFLEDNEPIAFQYLRPVCVGDKVETTGKGDTVSGGGVLLENERTEITALPHTILPLEISVSWKMLQGREGWQTWRVEPEAVRLAESESEPEPEMKMGVFEQNFVKRLEALEKDVEALAVVLKPLEALVKVAQETAEFIGEQDGDAIEGLKARIEPLETRVKILMERTEPRYEEINAKPFTGSPPLQDSHSSMGSEKETK